MSKVFTWIKQLIWNRYKVFKVNDDFIVAKTSDEALKFHLDCYMHGDREDVVGVMEVPLDNKGYFEQESGGYEEMTFKEMLNGFKYKEPQIVCWRE